MKKYIIALVVFLSFFTILTTIPVDANKTIVSPNLEEAVKFELGINPDEKVTISPEELKDLIRLDASWWEISDLTGLEYATNLKELYLEGNQLSNITPISHLSNLKILALADNNIKDISPLRNLNKISFLDLSRNEIDNVSSLSNMSFSNAKGGLDLSFNKISDISSLSNVVVPDNRDYFYLNLSNNHLTNLNGIANMTGLTELRADHNNISNVEGIKNLTNLRYISLQNNQITSLPNLSSFKNLQTLLLTNNKLTNIDFLSNITSGYIDLSNNQISNIDVLSNFQKGTVILNGNPLNGSATKVIKKLVNNGVQVEFDEIDFDYDQYRIYGSDRYRTAIAISKSGWENQSTNTVIIARGDTFPDALAGVPLAYAYNSPILLTGETLHLETIEEIKRLGAKNAIILGGKAAVSDKILKQLESIIPKERIERVAGGGRFETAVQIAEKLFKKSGKTDTAILAYGKNFPDALAAAPFAAQNGFPILLTETNKMPYATKNFLKNHNIKNIIIIGGDKVISSTIENELKSDYNVTRISGSGRYETATKIITDLNQTPKKVFIANGNNFPDALTGAVLAAKEKAPLLLVQKDTVPEATKNIFKKYTIEEFYVFGGDAVVSDSIIFDITMIK